MMISLKISVTVNAPLELKTKIKLETDSNQSALPFEDLIINTTPSEVETPNFQLRISNNERADHNRSVERKPWWQKIGFWN